MRGRKPSFPLNQDPSGSELNPGVRRPAPLCHIGHSNFKASNLTASRSKSGAGPPHSKMNLKLLPIYVLVLFLCILQNQPATTNHGPSMQPNVPTQARKGTRELGIKVGVLPRGTLNSITDVSGVMVGHRTLSLIHI